MTPNDQVERDEVVLSMLPRIEQLARYYSKAGAVGIEYGDLVSEGCLEVLQKWNRYEDDRGAALRTMLTVVVKNRMLNLLERYRLKLQKEPLGIDTFGIGGWEEAATLAASLRERLSDEGKALLDVLMQEGERKFHAKRAKKGLSEEELGERVGLSAWRKGQFKKEILSKLSGESV